VLHRAVVISLLFATVACAPLVSRRKRSEPPPPAAAAPIEKEPVAEAPPPPPPVVERAPPPAPVPAPEPEPEVIEQPPEPKERTTFYAFSAKEIQKLKMRSKPFRQLHQKHKKCTARTEKLIVKREALREQIIELQNMESRTRQEEKRLASLRAEERRMKQDKKSLAACEPLEQRLTEMLREEYGATASLDEPVY
jgi:hypothetical protein